MSTETKTPVTERREIPAWARERAEMLQGLYIHTMVFVLMNAGLFFINWATRGDEGTWWFLWVLVIWGVGLLIHVAVTITPVFRSDWVDKKAERIASQR